MPSGGRDRAKRDIALAGRCGTQGVVPLDRVKRLSAHVCIELLTRNEVQAMSASGADSSFDEIRAHAQRLQLTRMHEETMELGAPDESWPDAFEPEHAEALAKPPSANRVEPGCVESRRQEEDAPSVLGPKRTTCGSGALLAPSYTYPLDDPAPTDFLTG
jgi:hypothetical protein